MSCIEVKDLNIEPFHHLKMHFPKQSFTMIAGSNKSGKTAFIKALGGLILTNEAIVLDNAYLESVSTDELYQKVHIFLGNEQWHFLFPTVEEELRFPLENLGYSKEDIHKKLEDIIQLFHFSKILRLNPQNLNKYLKVKLLLAIQLISEPEILLLDDPTRMLTKNERKEIMSILSYYQSKQMTIIMTTSSLDDCLFADITKLYILHHGKIVLAGAVNEVFQEDSLLSKVGLRLPFMVDLCVKLKYYNLIDEMILDQESLVNHLWK